MPPQFENNVKPNNPETKPAKSHKFLITLFVLFLASAAFVWWYIYNLPLGLESETFATQTSEFSDWKTYRNEEYGFEFRYPTNWFIHGTKDNLYIGSTLVPAKLEGDPGNEISITIMDRNNHTDMKVWLQEDWGVPPKDTQDYRNKFGINFVQTESAPDIDPDNLHSYTFHNNQVLRIAVSPATRYKDVYNQILSTFKFTK